MFHLLLAAAPIVGLGPAYGVGGPLAIAGAEEQPQLRGFRFFLEGPGTKGSVVALEGNVWAGGWFGRRRGSEVDGAELRFEGRLPAGAAQVVMGYSGGVFVAPAITVGSRTERKAVALNAFVIGVRVPFPSGAAFADFTGNFFTIPTAAMKSSDKSTETMPCVLRGGAEVRPLERMFVRAMGTFGLFYGNAPGWQLDAGVIF